jgi:hypothetical protein
MLALVVTQNYPTGGPIGPIQAFAYDGRGDGPPASLLPKDSFWGPSLVQQWQSVASNPANFTNLTNLTNLECLQHYTNVYNRLSSLLDGAVIKRTRNILKKAVLTLLLLVRERKTI